MAGRGTMRQLSRGLMGSIPVKPRPVAVVPEVTVKTKTVRDMLVQIKDEYPDIFRVTLDQIDELIEVRYNNGNKILSLNDPTTIFDVVSLFMVSANNPEPNYATVIDYLQSKSLANDILWDQPLLQPARDKLLVTSELLQKKERGVKGIGKCSRCHSDELVFAEAQMRSADEPMTIFVSCLECGNRWKC